MTECVRRHAGADSSGPGRVPRHLPADCRPRSRRRRSAGVRAYEKARKNEAVELKPVDVTVRELELLDCAPRASDLGHRTSDLEIPASSVFASCCSSGFYVRSLAHDIGQLLGCGAHLEALRRTRAGRFRLADALTLDAIEAAGPAIEARLIGLNALLAGHAGGDADRRRDAAGRERQHAGAGPPRRPRSTGRRAGSKVRLLDAVGAPPVGRRTARRRAFASPPRPEVKY